MAGSLGSGSVEYHRERGIVHFANTVAQEATATEQKHDAVSHPAHYMAYRGLEVIDLTEQLNFNKGNAVKYIARAGLKDPEKEIEDIEKAVWYLQREITRISQLKDGDTK